MMMRTEVIQGAWTIKDQHGEISVVPFTDYIEEEEPCLGEPHADAFFARLVMPGHLLDCTAWSGPFETAKEALDAMWEDGCPSCGSEEATFWAHECWCCGDCGNSEQLA